MNHERVTELLTNYRSYRYAANNCSEWVEDSLIVMPKIYAERMKNPNAWDATRYNRIVAMIDGAVAFVLSDDQRKIINCKYLERNTMTLKQIAVITGCDPSTVSRWHTEALRRLSIALDPLREDEREISNIDHMFQTSA